MKLARIIFWEFLQNLPIVAGFMYALRLWRQELPWAAIAIAIVGSSLGAVTIALTESKKTPGHREPLPVLLTNALILTVVMVVVVIYFPASWSGWISDILIGVLAGTGLSAAQSWAAKEKVGLRHSFALGISASLALLGIRWITNMDFPFITSSLLILAPVTLIIGLIDYTGSTK